MVPGNLPEKRQQSCHCHQVTNLARAGETCSLSLPLTFLTGNMNMLCWSFGTPEAINMSLVRNIETTIQKMYKMKGLIEGFQG